MNKLYIYGDSIMKGVIYEKDSNQTYKLSKSAFKKNIEGYDISVKNNSRMGATIDNGLSSLEKTLPDCSQDTLVLLEYGGNDCDFDWKAISESPDEKHLPKTPAPLFAQKLRAMIA